jgi:hypothetical protein
MRCCSVLGPHCPLLHCGVHHLLHDMISLNVGVRREDADQGGEASLQVPVSHGGALPRETLQTLSGMMKGGEAAGQFPQPPLISGAPVNSALLAALAQVIDRVPHEHCTNVLGD